MDILDFSSDLSLSGKQSDSTGAEVTDLVLDLVGLIHCVYMLD